jgi:16S rRNA (cytosine967-C5)-methyltransferase
MRLPRGEAVESLPGFAGGDGGCRIWPPRSRAAAGRGQGRHVLDVCAAPGGKTMQLAAAGWQVTALDASARRLERVRENLARTGLSADLVAADALAWQPPAPFDAILLDAPCTATGTAAATPMCCTALASGRSRRWPSCKPRCWRAWRAG